MKYSKGYKYQLLRDERIGDVGIYPGHDIVPNENPGNPFICLTTRGRLTILSGYAWDGCSGPTIDRRTNMRACLAHDALSQLFRLGLVEKKWFGALNRFFLDALIKDGMWRPIAKLYKFGVSIDDFYVSPKNKRKVYYAP